MGRVLKAAVVGVGYLGRFHAQKYKAIDDVELIGVCDASIENAERVAKELNVSVLRLDELVGKVDLVTVATSTTHHFQVANELLGNGIAVNVEKPMTATIAQAEQLIQTAQKTGSLLAVGHIERFSSFVQHFARRANDFNFVRLTRKATYKSRGADVSVLYDLMIHDIDLALKWYGPIKSVQAMGARVLSKTWDEVTVLLTMESGKKVEIEVSRVGFEVKRLIYGSGPTGSLEVNTGTGFWREGRYSLQEPHSVWSEGQIEKVDPLLEETRCFVQAVRDGLKVEVSGQEGLSAMKAIELIENELEK